VALVLDMQGVIAAATRHHSAQQRQGRRDAAANPTPHPAGA
jgi:hypothetical protein